MIWVVHIALCKTRKASRIPYWSLESQQVFYSKIAHILIIVIYLFVSPDGFSCSYLNSNIYASFDVAKQVWKSFITVVARKINSGAEHRCQLRPVTCFKKSVINFLTWRTIQYFLTWRTIPIFMHTWKIYCRL